MSAGPFSPEHIKSGLAFVPYAQELGVEPSLMGDELTLILPYKIELIGNPVLEALHGGAVGAFMETTAIVQLWARGDQPELAKPISINIDYLRRGYPKDTYARAVITRQGSRVANVRVRAWQDNYQDPISVLHGNFLTAKDVAA